MSTFTTDVLAWGAPRLRDLPWRRTRDPWAVLVSEVMLQQTQVARVIPRWTAFLDRFPDAATCAAAPLGDVLREWQGLGYPRRARNLHATAQRVTELGEFPRDLDGLLALPGIGPYTARAVQAFAFELDAAGRRHQHRSPVRPPHRSAADAETPADDRRRGAPGR